MKRKYNHSLAILNPRGYSIIVINPLNGMEYADKFDFHSVNTIYRAIMFAHDHWVENDVPVPNDRDDYEILIAEVE